MLKVIRADRPLASWERPEGMPEMIYQLLLRRGIKSREEAEAFLHPAWEQVREPMALKDMDRATERIRLAWQRGERVCVYGDYDADGVCATAILLRQLRRMGVECDYYIPSRHREGYGLNEAAILDIAREHKLLVSLDCGVTSAALVEVAKGAGLDCVITDHHTPAAVLPDCPVVNPMLGGYPFQGVCGAGVAFKVALALRGEAAMEEIDLAAFATVADVVPLQDENRAIVALGLEKMNRSPRPGIRALMEASRSKDTVITAETIAFRLGPRVNASGRMGDASRALRLMLAETDEEAQALARELEAENQSRKSEETRILKEAEAQMEGFDFVKRRAIVLCGEDWNPGVVGLTASRITEKYGYPSILLTKKGEEYTGSCRSIEGVNIHQALTMCEEYLSKYGGHKQAAGLSLKAENLEPFKARLDEAIREISDPQDFVPRVACDMEYPLGDMTMEAVRMLSLMEPTGMGNPPPRFSARARVLGARAVGNDGNTLKMTLMDGDCQRGAVWFGHGALAAEVTDEEVEIVYAADINVYNGQESLQCKVQRLVSGERDAVKRDCASKVCRLQGAYLTNVLYNKRHTCPEPEAVSREEIKRLLAQSPQGTLVVSFTGDALDLPGADLLLGRWPQGPGCYNAVCVCPVGTMPKGYERVILWDLPPEMAVWGDMWTGETAEALASLPDIAAMRDIYRRARRGEAANGPYEQAGMAVLERLGLVEAGWQRGRPRVRAADRVDMEGDDAFCAMQRARERVSGKR